MKNTFDITDEIRDQMAAHEERTGTAPTACRVSRDVYRRLVEMRADDGAIGNLIIGTWSVRYLVVAEVRLETVIDESLSEAELVVE